MDVIKERVWIRKNEVIDILKIMDKSKLKHYSYTYKIQNKRGELVPCIRWDNMEQQPHVDKYDENSALIEQKSCRERSASEVVKLVSIFRKNLLSMDVSQL